MSYRYTEVKITPTLDSLGYNSLSEAAKEDINFIVNEINNNNNYSFIMDDFASYSTDAMVWELATLLDPDTPNPKLMAVTLHTGKTADTPPYNWINGVKINFEIECKGVSQKSQKGNVFMWNLSKATLDIIKAGAEIVINTGYNFRHDNIFVGVILEVLTERDNNDMRTSIKVSGAIVDVLNVDNGDWEFWDDTTDDNAADNEDYYFLNSLRKCLTTKTDYTYVGFTFIANSTEYNILESYGIELCFVGFDGTERNSEIFDAKYSSYIYSADHKTIKDKLNYLKDNFDIDWAIINKRLYIIKGLTPLPLQIRLTYLSGLITFNKSPKATDTDEEIILSNEYTVKSILIPDLFPKSLISIQPSLGSNFHNDEYYYITEVLYKSDNDEHVCEFKCTPATNSMEATEYINRVVEAEDEFDGEAY